MRRVLIVLCVMMVVFIASGVVLLQMKGAMILSWFIPVPSRADMYPPAPSMPASVVTPVEDLLLRHETFLKTKVPAVFSALQSGLTDADIDALEARYSLKLTPDLRALYRWRNGTLRTANVDAFPNHQFVPLDVALANRDELRRQVRASSPEQQKMYAMYAGHTEGWVGLIVDQAGDGYFFDPARTEAQGSFFFSFKEDGTYVFYPAFRNYLAAVVDGEKSGVFMMGRGGVDTNDFVKAQQFWDRYGAQRAR